MAKEDVVAAAVVSIQSAQAQALSDGLGSVYDQGAIDQKASDGTLSQADLDAAVAAAVGPLNQQLSDLTAKDAADIQAGIDAKAAGDAALAALQQQFDDLSAAKSVEDGVISGLNASIASIQGALDALHALFPAPPTA